MSARSSFWEINPLTQVPISMSASGHSTLVAGQPGKRVRVFRMKLIYQAATTIQFFDGPTELDNLVFPGSGAMVLDFNTIDMPAWYQTSPGNDFIISNSNGVGLSGNFDYLQSL